MIPELIVPRVQLADHITKFRVLEQGAAAKYLCNTRYTGGTFHICLREIMLDEAGEACEQDARRDEDLRDSGLRPCEFPLQEVRGGGEVLR